LWIIIARASNAKEDREESKIERALWIIFAMGSNAEREKRKDSELEMQLPPVNVIPLNALETREYT
jgi:hypothetical protein